MHRVLIAIAVILLGSTAANAQQKAVAKVNTPVYVGPAVQQVPLRVAAAGTRFRVVHQQDGWVQVEFNDPQMGQRTGWVQESQVTLSDPALEPMDLSVQKVTAPPQPAAPRTPASSERRPESAERELNQGNVQPQPQRPASEPLKKSGGITGYADVNFGFAMPAESTRSTTYTWTRSQETATLKVDYKQPNGASFDFGGGIMFTPYIGMGVSLSGQASQAPATVSLTVPHPYYYNAPATGTADTNQITYSESAQHIHVMLEVPSKNKQFRARFFGGPTHFTAKGSGVVHIYWDQAWLGSLNSVDVSSTELKEVSASTWGFNAGADISYFFSSVVGVGGNFRFSGGNVTIEDEDIMANEPVKAKLGGVQAAFGLRLRFGQKL